MGEFISVVELDCRHRKFASASEFLTCVGSCTHLREMFQSNRQQRMRSRTCWVETEGCFGELLGFFDRRDIQVHKTPPTALQQAPNIDLLTTDNFTFDNLCVDQRTSTPRLGASTASLHARHASSSTPQRWHLDASTCVHCGTHPH